MNEKRGLHSIALVDEDQVVVRPSGEENASKVPYGEVVVRSVLVHGENEGSSYPLKKKE